MNNQPSDTQDSLIKTIIQKRKVVYYLVSEDDINSLKTKSWLADTFMLIASVAWGAYFSVHITRATSIQLQDQAIGILNMLLWVFGIAGFFFTLLAVMFLIFAKSTIRRIKRSGKVKEAIAPSRFRILEATYGTSSEKSVDVTNKLNQRIHNGRLVTVASNDLAGKDPDFGTIKHLRIKYEHNGITILKEYNEQDQIELP